MVNLVIIGLAVLAGYLVTVACALVGTMALASSVPNFVIVDNRVRGGYKFVHELMWLLCTVIGAYSAARIGMRVQAHRQEALLIAVLLLVLWRNTWEARQRGTAHQILISLLTVIGVVGGFALEARLGQ